MNKTIWTILGTLMATSLIAQDNTNSLPAIPAPVSSPAAESAPAAAPAPAAATTNPTPPKHIRKHKAVVRKADPTPEPSVTLGPGSAEVNASDLVVRGQAGLKGEPVTHLHKGDTVTVLEQINLGRHSSGEPAQWAKIAYPKSANIWVDSKYINGGVVSTKKLNLRAGPGENYSVVGVVEQGASVTQVETKGNWMKIEPPADAFAFVAARYLTQEVAPTQVAVAPQEAPPAQTQVPEQTMIVAAPQPPPQPEVPPVRIISHEGVVAPVGSLSAPSDYKLYDPDTKQDIDFLYPSVPGMDFKPLVDARIVVSGEEGVQPNWPNTPVMAVQNIQVLETNVVKRFSRVDLLQPRQRH